jgi:hypothetical protein
MRIPSNIIETKYTSGNEFVFDYNYKYYQGYYYEFNGKYFAGKTFNTNAPKLVKANSTDINPLLTDPKTFIYGSLSKVKLNNSIPTSIINKSNINGGIRYFSKKINSNPILIREIDKNTFDKFQNNPYYQVISIEFPEGGYFGNQKSLDDAEKQMPGIKSFIISEPPPD